MSRPIRAIYSRGRLRLLDPVSLSEGQEVQLVILSEEEREHSTLEDMVVDVREMEGEEIDEEALIREIEAAFRGQASLSSDIIEERRHGP